MPTDQAGATGRAPEGVGDTTLLRNWLICGALLVDSSQQVTILTPEAASLLGLSGEPNAQAPLQSLPAPVQEIVRLATRSTVSDRRVELSVPHRGPVSVRLSAFRTPSTGPRGGVLVLLRDLSSVRRIEEHLQRLDRLANLGTLSASMAHEIRNALVAGRTFIDLLLEKNQDADLVEVVRRELGRIETLVSQMLNFAGLAKTTFAKLHLHDVLDQSLRLIEPQFQSQSIVATRAYRALADLIWGDDYHLQQAFVNLYLNALEAMPTKGALTLATELVVPAPGRDVPPAPPGTQWLRVKIQDTGTGIAPEKIGRIFEPFFTTKPEGTGLGLPITRRIIQEHGGVISVESVPDKGTTFTLMLPALESNSASPPPSSG
jgi:signal transduction histidine kinase